MLAKIGLADVTVRMAVRQLLKSPGFVVVSLLTLGLGIGASSTAFTVLNRLLFHPLPFRDPNRLVEIQAISPHGHYVGHSPGDYVDEKEQNTVFENMAAYYTFDDESVADPGQPPVITKGIAVDSDFLKMMGVVPILGRGFTAQDETDEASGNTQFLMLSYAYWQKHFNGDPRVLDRELRFKGTPVHIVGVVPSKFDDPALFGESIDIWTLEAPTISRSFRDNGWYQVAGRMKPGVTRERAQAELTTISARLARDYPKTDAKRGLKVVPYPTDSAGDLGRNLTWMVMSLTLVVLFIACANIANLQIVRTTGRAREFAVRLALGAPRGQIITMLLMESVLLSSAGGVLGLLIANWASTSLGAFFGLDMPINLRVVVFALSVSTVTGLTFGLMPAWFASRSDSGSSLGTGGRGTTADRSRHRLRNGLVIAEMALTLILLTGAGYFIRGIQRIAERELGWRPEKLLVGELTLPGRYSDDTARLFAEHVKSDLLGLPGVDHVAISNLSPLWGSYTFPLAFDGHPIEARGQEPLAFTNWVQPDFFATYGMHLLEGRNFTEADRRDSRPVAIINQAMAEVFWPGQSPLGKRIRDGTSPHPEWAEIVGVTNNILYGADFSRIKTRNAVYWPFAQQSKPYATTITLHSVGDPRILKESVRRLLAKLEPNVAFSSLVTSDEGMGSVLSPFALVRRILAEIAGLGLLLSAVGIYGVIAALASERIREVGIRMALGAQARDVCSLFLRNGVRLAISGSAVGLVGSFALLRILDRTVSIVPGYDPKIMIGVVVLLVLVALVACWLPARRATKVDPIIALRAE